MTCRVGRTGRLATDGHAFSFFTREMARLAGAMVDLLQQHGQVRMGWFVQDQSCTSHHVADMIHIVFSTCRLLTPILSSSPRAIK